MYVLTHITTRKETTGPNDGVVFIDHRMIDVTYRLVISTVETLDMSPGNFRIIASCVTAAANLITLRTKTFAFFQQSSTFFDTVGEEVITN
jgi:hypothetical protein